MGSSRGKGKTPHGYFQQSRDLTNSLVLVLPLLLVYQVGLFFSQGKTLNGVDLISIFLVRNYGWGGLFYFNLGIFAVGLLTLLYLKRSREFSPKILGPMLVESSVYALLLGFVIVGILRKLGFAQPGLATGATDLGLLGRICVSFGAGVHEEFVFRLGLFGGLWALFANQLGSKTAALGAACASSVLFSLAHYGSEPFQLYSFVYRCVAGFLFCGLFWARGFAIAVYTHALYDVLVLVVYARGGG